MSEPLTSGCARVASQAVRTHASIPLACNDCAIACAIGAAPVRSGWARIPTCWKVCTGPAFLFSACEVIITVPKAASNGVRVERPIHVSPLPSPRTREGKGPGDGRKSGTSRTLLPPVAGQRNLQRGRDAAHADDLGVDPAQVVAARGLRDHHAPKAELGCLAHAHRGLADRAQLSAEAQL